MSSPTSSTIPPQITILGGGPAGLAAGYFARKSSLSFVIYEARDHIGGNAITLQQGDFSFDTGAHRLHDKDPEMTQEIRQLLGKELKKIAVPSKIYYKGKFVDFPLSPFNLLTKLGIVNFMRAGGEVLKSKLRRSESFDNFNDFAVRTYGKTMAESFLLNYSEKLWGLPCEHLSPSISGKRMKGLTVSTFFREALLGKKAKTAHLDGSFYYPERGFGTIAEHLAEFCGVEHIRKNSKITSIIHNKNTVTAIEINGGHQIPVNYLISTLPLPYFLKILSPPPEKGIISIAEKLRFRDLILVSVFINKKSVTNDGSIYFPDKNFLFNRVYEPRNRSHFMSPEGKTSLCAEIPCFRGDEVWNAHDEDLISRVCKDFIDLGWISLTEIAGTRVTRLPDAYPVLEKGFEEKIQKIKLFLQLFSNLGITGRNGKFLYTHIHDMMRFGRQTVDAFLSANRKR